MSIIKVMSESLSNKIAAGEVVERCASVVKELVENSIDASSTMIKVEVRESGIKEIKVTDNGKGMDEEDAACAFLRHATSKLDNEDDLFRINTLGFRGEALASIAAVSKIDLITSTGDVGTHIVINGGKTSETKKSDARVGTTISVKNLFFNTPARLKHIGSLYSELGYIISYINRLALSKPNISFTLISDGKIILKTDGSGSLLKVINAIYGIDITKKMMEVSTYNNDYEINGYISNPIINKSDRNSIITLVNGRVVKNLELNRIIYESYHTYIPEKRFPLVVLNIKADPSLVDVNIHPTKQDIKFSNFDDLKVIIVNMIKDKLRSMFLVSDTTTKEKTEEIKPEKLRDLFDDAPTNRVLNISEPIETYTTTSLFEEKNNVKLLGDLYPKGLVFGTYIICEGNGGMYLIDQHAAKERINYENVINNIKRSEKKVINLIVPIPYEFTNDEYIILKENLDILRDLSFEIEEFGINTIVVKSHPTFLPENKEEAIKKIIDFVITKERDFSLEKFYHLIAATIACKMSIKGNTYISMDEAKSLIEELKLCENPFNCPHGRPTICFYSKYELEKMFKRSM